MIRLSSFNGLAWVGLLVLAAGAEGCGQGSAENRRPTSDSSSTVETHAHLPGEHGGLIVPIGHDEYHAEPVFQTDGDAEARIDEFRELASRLPVSIFLRRGSVAAGQRDRQGDLLYSLDTLDEFVKENQFGEAKAALRFVMDSYRTCRDEYVMSDP